MTLAFLISRSIRRPPREAVIKVEKEAVKLPRIGSFMCNQDMRGIKDSIKRITKPDLTQSSTDTAVKGFFVIDPGWTSENKRPFHVYKPRDSFRDILKCCLATNEKNE
eukprot:Seg3098.1 transcript_id=Seg3098.1/GoldUCD/mRNA.D3Y31 product="hypothetical protein" protein_id=Seg3098.1/GoldUCD/D3Y31